MYSEGKRAKHFTSQGCGKKRAWIGSVLMFWAEKLSEERRDAWLSPVGKGEFTDGQACWWEKDTSPIADFIKACGDASQGRLHVNLLKAASKGLRGS